MRIHSTPKLHFGKSILPKALAYFEEPQILLADEHLQKKALQISHDPILIPGGEGAKTREMQMYLENELFQRGCTRNTTLLILGGGTVCDLGGFIASTYLRGIPHVLIPTTLLCMVDASIGGKTGINTPFGKNMIGSFYAPKAIIADPDLLETLPKQEWLNGEAEILKLGIIYNPELLKKNSILQAMQTKMKITEKDPLEQGIRRILNYGHTIAHALETISDYQIPHGLAVALGCVVEAKLSAHLGYLSADDFIKIERLFQSYPLKLPREYHRPLFLKALHADKKRIGDQIRFVLPEKIGQAKSFSGHYCDAVTVTDLLPILDWMEKKYG